MGTRPGDIKLLTNSLSAEPLESPQGARACCDERDAAWT